MRLLLPKPRRDWPRWRQALDDTGVELDLVDPWRFEVFDESPQRRSLWLNLDLFQGVVCVSTVAAQVLADALDRYWPMPPAGVVWACNGPGTAERLICAGLEPRYPEHANTAEAVLTLPELNDLDGQKWLVVKGEGGRDFFTEVLTERGAEVTEADVYRRSLEPRELAHLVRRSDHADAVLVSSLTLADGLVEDNPTHWRRWPGLWLLSSERIARWARAHRLQRWCLTGGAAPAAVRETLLRIRP